MRTSKCITYTRHMKATELLEAALRSRWKQNTTASGVLLVSSVYIGDLIKGRRRISVPFAIRLSEVLNRPTLACELLYAQVNDELESHHDTSLV